MEIVIINIKINIPTKILITKKTIWPINQKIQTIKKKTRIRIIKINAKITLNHKIKLRLNCTISRIKIVISRIKIVISRPKIVISRPKNKWIKSAKNSN